MQFGLVVLKISNKIHWVIISLIGLTIFLIGASFQVNPMANIHAAYRKALVNDSEIETLVTASKSNLNNPLNKAYLGTAYALQARAAWTPTTKYSKAQDAYKYLNAAILASPKNFEIRFLRLSFSHGTPDFLNMKSTMAEDKKLFMQGDIKNHPLSDIMLTFVQKSNLFSDSEKATMK